MMTPEIISFVVSSQSDNILSADKQEKGKKKAKIQVMFRGQRIHFFPKVAKSPLLSLYRLRSLKTEFVGKDTTTTFFSSKEIKAPNRGEKIPLSRLMMPTSCLIFNLEHITYQR